MTQRAAALDLKLLIDDAKRERHGPRANIRASRAGDRLRVWLETHLEHRSTYVRYTIGPTRRHWLEAFEERQWSKIRNDSMR